MIRELYSLENFELNPTGASTEELTAAEFALGQKLPDSYKDFIREHNGGEGAFGENYLILWKVQELPSLNEGYEVETYAPGLVLFGSNGGGEAFAFNYNEPNASIVMLPFIGMSLEDATLIGPALPDLFVALQDDTIYD
ncbi:SMI1/KNR4 family protein [Pseudomonas monteilii]|uniref:SMI1/KNR4 family protein n=1 Tax=Pseudomonas monteilii TaxID=76759 RepID=UPI0037F1F168